MLERSGTLWDVPGMVRDGGTVFVTVSGTVGLSTIALKKTIRQIQRDRYSNEKGPAIYISLKPFT